MTRGRTAIRGTTTIVGSPALSAAGVEVIRVGASPTVAGHPERTAIAGGGACARAASVAGDSAEEDLAGAASAVFGDKRCEAESVVRSIWGHLCRAWFGTIWQQDPGGCR